MTRFPIDGTGRLSSEREHPTTVLTGPAGGDLTGSFPNPTLAHPAVSVSSFPQAGILDTFNRANESPLSDGGKWSAAVISGSAGYAAPLKLVSNAAVMTVPSAVAAASYWNVGTFTDCEVYCDVVSFGDSGVVDLWLRAQSPAGSSGSGYLIEFSAAGWLLQRFDAGTPTPALWYSKGVTISAGDSIGARIIGNVISAWHKPSGGTWTHVGTVEDTTYTSTAGYLALGLEDATTSTVLDNFGGGAVTTPNQVEPALLNSGLSSAAPIIIDSSANTKDPTNRQGYAIWVANGAETANQGPAIVWSRRGIANKAWPYTSNMGTDIGAGWIEFQTTPAKSTDHTTGEGFSIYLGNGVENQSAGLIVNINADGYMTIAAPGAANPDVWVGRLTGAADGAGVLEVKNQIQRAKATPTYSSSITPDASQGPWQTITVTNGTAFSINAPINPPDSTHHTELAIEVLNSSGGSMGAITWNAAFIFATGAWANPANTKKRFARFEWNGLKWLCTSLASSDY